MSAPEPASPFARCLRAGLYGTASAERPLTIVEWRLSIARVIARRESSDDVRHALQQEMGLELPQPGYASSANSDITAIWVAPNTWLITRPAMQGSDLIARIADAIGVSGSVVDQSCGYAALRLSGARTRELLAKGCRIDLHPRAFGPGRAAVTLLAHVHVVLRQVDEIPTFELIVPSTLAEHVFEWLCLSVAEFGYEVRV